MSRELKVALAALVSCVLCAAVLFGLELFLRAFDLVPLADFSMAATPLWHPECYRNSPVLGYEYKPASGSASRCAPRNSLGLISPEYPRKKAPGIFRAAVLGDSVMMDGLLDAARRDFDEERVLGKSWEFWNFAVPGYNAEQYALVLEEKVLKTSPDMVVVAYSLTNLYPFFLIKSRRGDAFLRTPFLGGLRKLRMTPLFDASRLYRLAVFARETRAGRAGREPETHAAYARRTIADTARSARKAGVPLAAIVFPLLKKRGDYSAREAADHELLLSELARNRVPVIDLHGSFPAADPRMRIEPADELHFGPRGVGKVSPVLARLLRGFVLETFSSR